MIGRGPDIRPVFTASVLALAAVLAASWSAQAIEGIVAEDAWSPDRDAAVVAERSSRLSLAEYQTEDLPAPSPVANSRLMSRRPGNLSRPAPWTTSNFVADEQATETLPRANGAAPSMSPQGLPVPSGLYHDQGPMDGDGGGCCGVCCGSGCGNCCGDWQSCGPAPICCLLPQLDCSSFELFGGVQGFTGPPNRGGGGSFGFHEGFNWGSSFCGCGAFQVGANWTQSNLDGSFITDNIRHQTFLTAGWFRRCDMGLQGGVVVDWQHDDWDYEVDLAQLRGELSWKCCQDDFGCWFTIGINDDGTNLNVPVDAGNGNIRIAAVGVDWQVNDMYAFFWRRQFACGGEGRAFGGFTANGQGLLGANAQVPINPCWDLRGGFLYVVPDEEQQNGVPDFVEETWNVSLALVWTPFKRPDCGPNYCRPLFNVADNGSFASRVIQ